MDAPKYAFYLKQSGWVRGKGMETSTAAGTQAGGRERSDSGGSPRGYPPSTHGVSPRAPGMTWGAVRPAAPGTSAADGAPRKPAASDTVNVWSRAKPNVET